MSKGMLKFLDYWDTAMRIGAGLFFLVGTAILVYSFLKLALLKDNKEKYDFISKYEIKNLYYVILFNFIALGLILNTAYREVVVLSAFWIFVRLFVTFCVSTLFVYILTLLLKYVYPGVISKHLRQLRYSPRISPKTGKPMKLLSEEEEDVHLEQGMQVEENLFSLDYDVWVDEESGYIKIEKYPGQLQFLECKSCGFQTMKLMKEKIIEAPTETSEGELVKYYECSFCHKKRHINKRIAKLSTGEYALPENYHFKEEKKVVSVKIEIQTNLDETNTFEFKTITKAKEFLEEYEHELNAAYHDIT